MSDFKYHEQLLPIAEKDVRFLRTKDLQYDGSWRRRGGIGAFMMLARKWDRLEAISGSHGYDVFGAVNRNADSVDALGIGAEDSDESSALNQIRDLRRYLLLLEAYLADKTKENGKITYKGVTGEERARAASFPGGAYEDELMPAAAVPPEDSNRHADRAPKRLELLDGRWSGDGPPPSYAKMQTTDPLTGEQYEIIDRYSLNDSLIARYDLTMLRGNVNSMEFKMDNVVAPHYRGLYKRGETGQWELDPKYQRWALFGVHR